MLPIAVAFVVGIALVFGPGWFFVRRFDWRPLELLSAAVGLSLTLLFVASFLAHWIGAPPSIDVLITVVGIVMTVAAWRDARVLFRDPGVRRTVFALAGLTVWTILLLTLIRQYGGGNWCCDWLEHYQRTQHFVTPWPDEFLFIGVYPLSTRPPLMNVVASHLMGPVGVTFPAYQVTFSSLNALVLLPVVLLSGLLSRRREPSDPRLAAVALAFNPVFFMNTTYAWTKALTAFFVLLALALYLEARRLGDERRSTAAFVSLAAATLTHYSAALVAIPIAAHYLAVAVRDRRPRAWRTLVPCLLLLSLWPAYSFSTSGPGFFRNVTVEGGVERSLPDHIGTRLLNLRDTVVPARYDGYRGYPDDATTARRFTDQVFTLYHGNLLLTMGAIGGPLIVVLAAMAFRRASTTERAFWTTGVAWLFVTGVMIHGDRVENGLSMIALQPLTYLGIAFLLSRLHELPAWVRRIWFAGVFIDGVLGVALPLWFQRADGEWARTPNWAWKTNAGVTFLGDLIGSPMIPIVLAAAGGTCALVFVYRKVARA